MGVNVDHRTFLIERELPGIPAHAFGFWSDYELKRRWNTRHPDWEVIEDSFDFRLGGSWRMPEGQSRRCLQLPRNPSS